MWVCGRRERSRPGQDVRYDVGKENGASEIKILGHPSAPLCSVPPPVVPSQASALEPAGACAPASRPRLPRLQCSGQALGSCFFPTSCQRRARPHPNTCTKEMATWERSTALSFMHAIEPLIGWMGLHTVQGSLRIIHGR